MSTPLLHTLYLAVPLALFALLVLMIYSRKSNRPPTYRLTEKWTYGPILWSATDEVLGGGHGHHGAATSVGGGASGKW